MKLPSQRNIEIHRDSSNLWILQIPQKNLTVLLMLISSLVFAHSVNFCSSSDVTY